MHESALLAEAAQPSFTPTGAVWNAILNSIDPTQPPADWAWLGGQSELIPLWIAMGASGEEAHQATRLGLSFEEWAMSAPSEERTTVNASILRGEA